ncbi:MAG: tetratricopeptide repeat protein [Bacillota bacterium]|nr:tetratricopeptide repeat protein [Bacillota bacterium]
MSVKGIFAEKVSKMMFLELKLERIKDIFGVEVVENVYMPIRSSRMIDKIKAGDNFETIPVDLFIEGMFYILGADREFKYNNSYKIILNTRYNDFIRYIKGIIFKEAQKEEYEEAYIMLKGLISMENNKENFHKLFLLAERLRLNNKDYELEELAMIEEAKNIQGYSAPYLYEAIIKNKNKDFAASLECINRYIAFGGEQTVEVLDLKHNLENIKIYDKGKELLYKKPKEALKYFLSLIDEFQDDAILLYNIAIAYRIVNNHEKAIYYLNEALAIDSDLVEVVNELGINYAALGDYKTSEAYLRKAFEVTKSVEICTNLIMCYINMGNLKQAKLHLNIAEKINPEDEIVIQLKEMLR